jgi:hypothetical protein
MGTLTARTGVATTKSQFIMKVVMQTPGHGALTT